MQKASIFVRTGQRGIEIGRRCAAASMADVCAMGAQPAGVLLAIGMPGSTTSHWAGEFLAGFMEEADSAGAVVLGGDVSDCENIVISVTAIGPPPFGSSAGSKWCWCGRHSGNLWQIGYGRRGAPGFAAGIAVSSGFSGCV